MRRIGPIFRLGLGDRNMLLTVASRSARNVTVTSSSLSYTGNVTSLSITLSNTGKSNATLFGVILGGRFNITLPKGIASPTASNQNGQSGNVPAGRLPRGGFGFGKGGSVTPRFNTPILFILQGDTLVPMMGSNIMRASTSFLTLKPGESVTLTFSGVLQTRPFGRMATGKGAAVIPIASDVYNIRLNGMYVRTSTVTATKG